MALTSSVVISSITILEDAQIQIRRTRRILDDLEVVGEQHQRFVLEPGQDVTSQPARVRSICNLLWTPAVIAAYQAAKAAGAL